MRTLFNYLSLVVASVAVLLIGNAFRPVSPQHSLHIQAHRSLSDYGFFQGMLRDMKPAAGVVRYDVNTSLFTDYAYKARFVKLPQGVQLNYDARSPLDLPAGSVIIKHFYYPADFRKPTENLHFVETRLLIHQPTGWEALTYVWDENQVDATLTNTGAEVPVQWLDATGKKREVTFTVPTRGQCRGCHNKDGEMAPIGFTVRQLNRTSQENPAQNQLAVWQKAGIITGMPHISQVPRLATWDDPATGDLDSRARAWLDVNCGYCHNPEGTANISAFYLDIHQTDPRMLGIYKEPLFAGRASGGLSYDIVPGKPDESILYYRIATHDLVIQMPEIGKQMVHDEGVALIREWIEKMPKP